MLAARNWRHEVLENDSVCTLNMQYFDVVSVLDFEIV
jgi:hypothetical protein